MPTRDCEAGYGPAIEDGRLPKEILYGELASGNRRVDGHNKDVIKCDMQSTQIKSNSWEGNLETISYRGGLLMLL